MKIKNDRLKNYIYSNTDSTIRGRSNSLVVKDLEFSEDYQSVQAKINGKKYDIRFYGLQSGMISSSCTCPYDWGNVCKHEVAVAFEIDNFVDSYQETSPIISPKKETKPKITYSKVEPILIPFKGTKDIKESFLKKNANNRSYDRYKHYYDTVSLIDSKPEYLHFRLNQYRDYNFFDIQLRKKGETLSLLCNCTATNKTLCSHQVHILRHINEEMKHAFLSDEEMDGLKNNLLKEYGFSIKDNDYATYFSFEFINNELTAIPKEKGILKFAAHTNINTVSENLFSDLKVFEDELPVLPKKSNRKQKQGIAYSFSFYNSNEYVPTIATPLTGNLNKDETALFSKIEEITPETVFYTNSSLIKEEQTLLELAFQLSENRLAQFNKKESLSLEKHSLIHLKKLLPLLKNKRVFKLLDDDNERKISRNFLTPIIFSTNSSMLSFKVIEELHFFNLKSYITVNGKTNQLNIKKIGNNFLFTIVKNAYYLNKSINYSKTLLFFKQNPEIRIPKSDFDTYNTTFIIPLSKKHKVDYQHLKKKKEIIEYTDAKKQLYISETDNHIVLKPILEYNNQFINILGTHNFQEVKDNTVYTYQQNEEKNKAFIDLIAGLHPTFNEEPNNDFFFLNHDEFIKDMWFLNTFEKLKEENIEIFGLDALTKMKYNAHKPTISMNVSSGIDWFDVNIDIAFGKTMVSLKDVKKSILNKSNYVQLGDGSIGILPEKWIEKYTHLFRSGDVKKDSIEVSKYQISVIDSLYEHLDDQNNLVQQHQLFKEKLQTFNTIEKIPQPKGIKATLRDYQKEGLNWLAFLNEFGFGGCLADDMGLGKTLQIISFFKYIKDTKKSKVPHLVIVPTSLIFNWQEEIIKFCKTLKVLVLSGIDREKNSNNFEKNDIVLTTYGTILRDLNYLKEYTFNYIVLDESQAIKNPNSQRFKAVRLLKSENKLVLTGTPIENNTFDLYAQMTFVNPGLLGSMAHFKKEFSTPIDKEKNTDVAVDLRKLINPFLLRRTKEQVAKELPPKTEQILYCSMENEQQKLYDAYKNKYRDYLLKKIDSDGLGKSKMYVLEGLTKLRQICDSPQLLNDDETYTSQSIKIKELLKHINQKTGKHKILIFSQFVKMLHLIKKELEQSGISFEYLDGKTKNRQEKVTNFQNNTSVRVFLISLKAGGTGLNLTEADYVYLVDPWWNPAVEAQAIDRCYRIGQNKHVFAYKMICKNTIEEKIIQHQLTKKKLSSDIIQTDESFVKSLSKEHIIKLFE